MNGILGAKSLIAGITQSIYVCNTVGGTIATISVCNKSNKSMTVNVAVTAGSNVVLPAEWLEYQIELLPKAVLERTGVVISSGQYLTIQTSEDCSANCWGFEMGDAVSSLKSVVTNVTAPSWTTSNLTPLSVDTGTPVQLAATDPNSDPLTYSVTNGKLPDGVLLSTSGQLTGKAATAGIATIAVSDGTNSVPRIFNFAKVAVADGSSANNAGASAYSIKVLTSTTTNGLYWINVNGTARQVWCDMSTDGGGWMRFYNGGSATTPALAGAGTAVGDPATGRGKYSDADITWLLANAPHNTSLHTLKIMRIRVLTYVDYLQVPASTTYNNTVSRSRPQIADGWDTYAQFTSSPNTVTYTNGSNLASTWTYASIGSYNTWGQGIMTSMSPGRDAFWSGDSYGVQDTNDAEVWVR